MDWPGSIVAIGLRRAAGFFCSGISLGLLAPFVSTADAAGAPSSPKDKSKPSPAVDNSEKDKDALKPYQSISHGPPPLSPTLFTPDFGVAPTLHRYFYEEHFKLQLTNRYSTTAPPQPPLMFNPDPGAYLNPPKPVEFFFRTNFGLFPPFGQEAVPDDLKLPRESIRRQEWAPVKPEPRRKPEQEPLSEELKLPRNDVRANERIPTQFHNPKYPLGEADDAYPTNTVPRANRWRIRLPTWQRYDDPKIETPYRTPTPRLWHPYEQSMLKGDLPIIGQDVFLNLTVSSATEFEARRLPVPSGVSSERPSSSEFFGRGEQLSVQNNFALGLELFKGETVFQPVHWALRLQPVYNINYIDVQETGLVRPSPAKGTTRLRDYFALQEWFGELHLRDLSNNYDFFAMRLGNQPFISDFRGFIFNDVNFGLRIFGNIDNNRYQYNFMTLDLREKDTNSELNTFDARDQRVLVANIYRQDFLVHGYTAQLSLHANFDDATTQYDRNGFIVRPAPFGTVREHDVRAYYLGWAGDGHIGRWNVTHAFYQVFGKDGLNGLAGRSVDINAQMAALELSYDRDWIRYKASFFYASGDDNAEDGTATGFDTILDNPNFVGGPFSFYVRQGFNLAGTAVNLKQRGSLVPDLRTSKTQGQANFVNPGVFIFGLGTDIDVTPKLRSFINVNYIRFAETDPIKTALLTDKVGHELGLDCSLGFQYRPLLTDNIIFSAGFGAFVPGTGYRDIYRRSTDPVPTFNSTRNRGGTDDFLYSGLFAVTFTY